MQNEKKADQVPMSGPTLGGAILELVVKNTVRTLLALAGLLLVVGLSGVLTVWGALRLIGVERIGGVAFSHSSSATPIGTVVAFAGAAEPEGWRFCNGQDLDVEPGNQLLPILGTRYGPGKHNAAGDLIAVTLPDYRGMFLRGVAGDEKDPGWRSRTPLRPDATAKAGEVGTFEAESVGRHMHSIAIGRGGEPGGLLVPASVVGSIPAAPSTGEPTTCTPSDCETRPRNVSVQFLIRTKS